MSRDVHDALDDVGGLGAASAAVGVGGHLIGEDTLDFDVDGRELVTAGEHERRELRNQWRQELMVSAEIGQDAHAKA